jgi:hypothetical protein
MGVIALHVPGHGNPAPLQILLLIVLIAAVYFISREAFKRRINRRNGK